MDPSTNQPVVNPNLPIVQPNIEQPKAGIQPAEVPAQPTSEAAPAPVEVAPQPGSVSAPVQQPVQAQPPPMVAAPPAQAVHTGSVAGRALQLQNLEAGDEDLIEKEWVDKAEEIIRNDEDNPSVEDQHQSEMNKAYLKKRFNLDVS